MSSISYPRDSAKFFYLSLFNHKIISDYDAPLTENGNYTQKYHSAASKIAEYDPVASLVSRPDLPEIIDPIKYSDVEITEQIGFEDILDNVVST